MKKNDKELSGSIKKNDTIIIDIDTVTENGELYNKSFFEIKKWFFETYPEVA